MVTSTDHLHSDLQMLRDLGAKFLGRAAHIWGLPSGSRSADGTGQKLCQRCARGSGHGHRFAMRHF